MLYPIQEEVVTIVTPASIILNYTLCVIYGMILGFILGRMSKKTGDD